jgi:RNA polymerase sigma-70 factor, ECF subfamily
MTSSLARYFLPTQCGAESVSSGAKDLNAPERVVLESRTDLVAPVEDESLAGPRRERVDASDSDEGLLVLVSQGDAEALTTLFGRYAPIVRGVAYRVLRDPSEADDLLQDLFILILRKCRMFDPTRGPARFWILQMAYHCALGRRRYLNSRHFYTRVDLADIENELSDRRNGEDGGLYGDDRLSENSDLKRVFDALSNDQQETLRLFFAEGYTLPEIAVKLNQTHGNIKHHYFRGLEKLRKHVFDGKLRANSAV